MSYLEWLAGEGEFERRDDFGVEFVAKDVLCSDCRSCIVAEHVGENVYQDRPTLEYL